jgi:hypothetical protein
MRCNLSRSSGDSSAFSFTTVVMSTGPRCLFFGRYFSRVSGGWIGSNSSVASLPYAVSTISCDTR